MGQGCPVPDIIQHSNKERYWITWTANGRVIRQSTNSRWCWKAWQRDTTQEEVCKKFGVSISMLHRWRKKFQTNAESVFQDKRDPKQKARSQGYEPGEAPDDLKKIIGELTVQNEILKKASGLLRK